MADGITVERHGSTALVWLDRPDRRNAFTSAMQTELHRQFDRLDTDEGVRVIVVTGRGRHFSAGADMEPGGSNFAFDDERHRAAKAQMAARRRPWQLRTPIIGALNGSAVGLGLTFPVQWDIRIVNEAAKYGFVFTRRGLIPEQNSLWLLPKLVGLATALDLLLTGRLFSGADAKELGLATEAVPADHVLARAMEIADDIASTTAPAA
ncbi:enoyl-CoA hydratase-related protein, partial [Mycobacterium sp.]|uniref:enoyl-CoA hydratase-related protein n=1 Tax=Mycobacterium sp. TaxID=1785 RepID=UPI003C790492